MKDNDIVGNTSGESWSWRAVATLLMLMSASCSSALEDRVRPITYVILIDAGPVLIHADGFAHGFTQSALEASVRKGLIQAHRGQLIELGVGEVTPARRMLLHVEEGFRPTRAQLTLAHPIQRSEARFVS